jgi:hypothetical protein
MREMNLSPFDPRHPRRDSLFSARARRRPSAPFPKRMLATPRRLKEWSDGLKRRNLPALGEEQESKKRSPRRFRAKNQMGNSDFTESAASPRDAFPPCPKCGGHNIKVRKLPNPAMLFWVLNPGLAFNELVLGQRIAKAQLFCNDCAGSLVKRNYVHCPHCNAMIHGQSWSGEYAFGNWLGLVCPHCGKRIPCLWNFTSLLILALTCPFWYLPYRYYFRDRVPRKPILGAAQRKPFTKRGLRCIGWVSSLVSASNRSGPLAGPMGASRRNGSSVVSLTAVGNHNGGRDLRNWLSSFPARHLLKMFALTPQQIP